MREGLGSACSPHLRIHEHKTPFAQRPTVRRGGWVGGSLFLLSSTSKCVRSHHPRGKDSHLSTTWAVGVSTTHAQFPPSMRREIEDSCCVVRKLEDTQHVFDRKHESPRQAPTLCSVHHLIVRVENRGHAVASQVKNDAGFTHS